MDREIKGPEDVAFLSAATMGDILAANFGAKAEAQLKVAQLPRQAMIPAYEVGQIIDLVLEAGTDRPNPELLGYERYDRREANYQAWLTIARNLRERKQ